MPVSPSRSSKPGQRPHRNRGRNERPRGPPRKGQMTERRRRDESIASSVKPEYFGGGKPNAVLKSERRQSCTPAELRRNTPAELKRITPAEIQYEEAEPKRQSRQLRLSKQSVQSMQSAGISNYGDISANQLVFTLQRHVDQGHLSEAVFQGIVKDIQKSQRKQRRRNEKQNGGERKKGLRQTITSIFSIGRGSGRSTVSEVSDHGFKGVDVTCTNCGTKNNSANGCGCLNCYQALFLDSWDHTKVFQRPDEDSWAGERNAALQYRGGKFYTRIVGLNVNVSKDQNKEDYTFVFECAWQKTPRSKIQVRWLVELKLADLDKLHKKIIKSKSSVLARDKTFMLPEYPTPAYLASVMFGGPVEPAVDTKKAGGRKKKRAQRSLKSVYGNVSDEQILAGFRKWLGQIIDSACENNTFRFTFRGQTSMTNPLFKVVGFDNTFRLAETKSISKGRRRQS